MFFFLFVATHLLTVILSVPLSSLLYLFILNFYHNYINDADVVVVVVVENENEVKMRNEGRQFNFLDY